MNGSGTGSCKYEEAAIHCSVTVNNTYDHDAHHFYLLGFSAMNNNVIRILIVDGKLITGGVEAFIMNIYRHIDRSRFQFDFLVHYKEAFFYDEEVKRLGGKIHYLTFRNDNNIIKYIHDLKVFFREHHEYKIVWGQMDGLAGIYLRIAKEEGIPVTIMHSHVTSVEKNLKGAIKNLIHRKIPAYADYRFACSTEAGKYLYGDSSFSIIHNAVETEKYKYDEDARIRIRSANNWNGCHVVGHVGRFFQEKNHRYIIDLFEQLTKMRDKYRLCLCGEGEELDGIRQIVRERGLTDKVLFTGGIKNVNEYYQAFDAFVLPSLYEGLPVSGVEAQTSGLICFFSDRITEEVSLVPENVEFLSINDAPEIWAQHINSRIQYERKDQSGAIINQGYDIHTLVLYLEKLFTELQVK